MSAKHNTSITPRPGSLLILACAALAAINLSACTIVVGGTVVRARDVKVSAPDDVRVIDPRVEVRR